MDSYELFKELIYKKSGIDLSSYKERQMKRRIDSLIRRNNFKSYREYYAALEKNKDLYEEFINFLTINVSEFFRNYEQWQILERDIIPEMLSRKKNLKIWSSACSTGEEPYSTVMLLSKFLPLKDIKILASDIDKEAIRKALIGVYSAKSIENVPEEYKRKYFEKEGNSYKISENIKNCVEFFQHNLLRDPYPKDCDLIICRNVMIYFTEEAKDKIYRRFNEALDNEGILFVGSTEQIIMPHRYEFKVVKTFFYKKM